MRSGLDGWRLIEAWTSGSEIRATSSVWHRGTMALSLSICAFLNYLRGNGENSQTLDIQPRHSEASSQQQAAGNNTAVSIVEVFFRRRPTTRDRNFRFPSLYCAPHTSRAHVVTRNMSRVPPRGSPRRAFFIARVPPCLLCPLRCEESLSFLATYSELKGAM